MVEALLVLPLLLILLNGIIWIGEMGRAKIVMLIAVREGARCESLGIPGEAVARSICLDNLPIEPQDLEISIERTITKVTVGAKCKFAVPFSNSKGEYYVISTRTAMPLSIL